MKKNEQERFTLFTKELAELSKKYGVVLQSSGGVMITNLRSEKLQNISYVDDSTSGDLLPLNWFDD